MRAKKTPKKPSCLDKFTWNLGDLEMYDPHGNRIEVPAPVEKKKKGPARRPAPLKSGTP